MLRTAKVLTHNFRAETSRCKVVEQPGPSLISKVLTSTTITWEILLYLKKLLCKKRLCLCVSLQVCGVVKNFDHVVLSPRHCLCCNFLDEYSRNEYRVPAETNYWQNQIHTIFAKCVKSKGLDLL